MTNGGAINKIKKYIHLTVVIGLLVILIAGCAPAKNEGRKGNAEGKKVAFYRNPMNPQVTSPVPMKDEMGMEYIAVYEKEPGVKEGEITISPEGQKLIGVKSERVKWRDLYKEIRTVGEIAFDPELYVAEEEYIAAEKIKDKNLVGVSKKRLKILGLGEEQIEQIRRSGYAQNNLILPEEKVWVYITIYENEMGVVKRGTPVEIETVAYPGSRFYGKIIAISPNIDQMTRSAKARALVRNPSNKLKPGMFANVTIKIGLGSKLSVPEDAVINTGKRTIVVVLGKSGNYSSRDVVIGQRAAGYYEVISGLKQGDIAITSGNFLIDSESRLNSSQSQEHKH